MIINYDLDNDDWKCYTIQGLKYDYLREEMHVVVGGTRELLITAFDIRITCNLNSRGKAVEILIEIYKLTVEKYFKNENIKSFKDFIKPFVILGKLEGE